MSQSKSPQKERAMIVEQPSKRPYGVRVQTYIRSVADFGNVERVCVSLPSGAFLTIEPTQTAPWEGGRRFIVTVEGFPTAASAETAGRRLVQALLWTAIKCDFPLRLEYQSYEPAFVFERNRSTGISCYGYGQQIQNPLVVLTELHDAYASLPDPHQNVLLSMEIFCAARLELSQRTVFLSLVSALEPLADAAELGEHVSCIVEECISKVRESDGVDDQTRDSLVGRLNELRHESIRQALRRLVYETLPTRQEAKQVVDEAYCLRSQLIHKGMPEDPDTDLDDASRVVAEIIKAIYASILNRAPP